MKETGDKMILSIFPKRVMVDGVLMRVAIRQLLWHKGKEYKYLQEPNAATGFWYDCASKTKTADPRTI